MFGTEEEPGIALDTLTRDVEAGVEAGETDAAIALLAAADTAEGIALAEDDAWGWCTGGGEVEGDLASSELRGLASDVKVTRCVRASMITSGYG